MAGGRLGEGRFAIRWEPLGGLGGGAVVIVSPAVAAGIRTRPAWILGTGEALGYPASPDHSEKRELFRLLNAGQFGMSLTDSCAMSPAASVSGLIFANPASRYFTVGRIGRDQTADYAARRGVPLAEVERWLRPNLGYEPS